MENKILTTTHGYTVTIRPFLTYDQFIDIQKIWTQNMIIDPNTKDETPKLGKIPASTLYEANRMAVAFLVVDIVDAKGVKVNRGATELPIPPADGAEIMEVIKTISDEAAASFDKKKAKTS